MKYNLEDKSAANILRKPISDLVIKDVLERFDLSAEHPHSKTNIEKLMEHFSSNQITRLLGFLSFLETFGRDFYQNRHLNYNRRTYFKNLAELRKAGIYH